MSLPAFSTPHPTINKGILPDQIGFNLRRAYFTTTQIFAGIFADLNLTPIQFAVLEMVQCNPALTQKCIAAHIGTASSVLVSPMRKLEERGLLTRTRSDSDRREHHFTLTNAGISLHQQALQHIQTVETQLSQNLTANERQTLLILLHKIIEN